MLCCVNDCGREAHYVTAALCQMHYFRQWRTGTTELVHRERKQRLENPQGYQWVYAPDHPLRHKSSGYVAEHRGVVYADYGEGPLACEICARMLTWSICHVDHIDENPRNNARENLRPTCSRCNTWRSMPPAVEWNRTHVIEFEGKRLTPTEWARDPRVKVAGRTIVLRKMAGMSDEQALFAPKVTHNGKAPKPYQPITQHKHERKNAIRIEIDGVVDTAAGWSRHPDCQVSRAGIASRLKSGWPARDAVFKANHLHQLIPTKGQP